MMRISVCRFRPVRYRILATVTVFLAATLLIAATIPQTITYSVEELGSSVDGFWLPEHNSERVYRWTDGNARIFIPELEGASLLAIAVQLSAPQRPDAPSVAATVNSDVGWSMSFRIAPEWRTYRFLIDARSPYVAAPAVAIITDTWRASPSDGRTLGVVIGRLKAQRLLPSNDVAVAGRWFFLTSLTLLVALIMRRLFQIRLVLGALTLIAGLLAIWNPILLATLLPSRWQVVGFLAIIVAFIEVIHYDQSRLVFGVYSRSKIVRRHIIFLLFICVILLRVPHITWPGRFWAEEGAIYFSQAYGSSIWKTLLTIDLGYYSFFNKIAVITADRLVELEFAPVITALFALVSMAIPLWLLLYANREFSDRPFAYLSSAVILFTQPNQEVWLNTINSQFYFCLSVAIILITSPQSGLQHSFRLGILGLAGLTGVLSCLLMPFFYLDYALSRKRHRIDELLVLTLACVVQIVCIVTTGGRESGLHLDLLPWVLLVKQWILPTFGADVANFVSELIKQHRLWQDELLSALAVTPYLILGFCLLLWGSRKSLYLFTASIFIASFSFFFSVGNQNEELMLEHLSDLHGGRYYYAPNVMLVIALLFPTRWVKLSHSRYLLSFRALSYALVTIVLFVGIHDYMISRQRHQYFFEGPSWTSEIKRWQRSETDVLNIWPRSWTMVLPKATIRVKPSAGADVPSLAAPSKNNDASRNTFATRLHLCNRSCIGCEGSLCPTMRRHSMLHYFAAAGIDGGASPVRSSRMA